MKGFKSRLTLKALCWSKDRNELGSNHNRIYQGQINLIKNHLGIIHVPLEG